MTAAPPGADISHWLSTSAHKGDQPIKTIPKCDLKRTPRARKHRARAPALITIDRRALRALECERDALLKRVFFMNGDCDM